LRSGRPDQAGPLLRHGLQLAEELALDVVVVEAKAALARHAIATGQADQAQAFVDDVLAHLAPSDLAGALDPGEVYVACLQVLEALHDDRASVARRAARAYLDHAAAMIDEADLRSGILTRVPTHVELARALRG
jgi:hypothetical protein